MRASQRRNIKPESRHDAGERGSLIHAVFDTPRDGAVEQRKQIVEHGVVGQMLKLVRGRPLRRQ